MPFLFVFLGFIETIRFDAQKQAKVISNIILELC